MNDRITRSKTYLLPLLANTYNIPTSKIVGLFLGIKGHDKKTGHVYVWVSDDTDIKGYINKIVFDKDILLEYEYPNNDIYSLFINGLYSRFPDKYKNEIIKFFKLKKDHTVVQVLYKSPFLKKEIEERIGMRLNKSQELGEKISYEEELYNPSLSRD